MDEHVLQNESSKAFRWEMKTTQFIQYNFAKSSILILSCPSQPGNCGDDTDDAAKNGRTFVMLSSSFCT